MNFKLSLIYLLTAVFLVACGTKNRTVLQSRNPKGNSSTTNSTPRQNTSTSRSGSGWDYIQAYKGIAIEEMNRYGIPASIKLAQALLESGNGNSYLAKNANNHFGIKCGGSWNGRSISRPDDGPNDCFRVYRDPAESFKDHSQFLLRKRYEQLFRLDKDDYKGWARGLKAAGYATNPKYAQLLIDLIERYDLHQYDKGETYAQKEYREEKVEEIIVEHKKEEQEILPEEIKKPVAMKIHEVRAGDTLYAIASKYGIAQDELIAINGLAGESLSIGQLLIVSK